MNHDSAKDSNFGNIIVIFLLGDFLRGIKRGLRVGIGSTRGRGAKEGSRRVASWVCTTSEDFPSGGGQDVVRGWTGVSSLSPFFFKDKSPNNACT